MSKEQSPKENNSSEEIKDEDVNTDNEAPQDGSEGEKSDEANSSSGEGETSSDNEGEGAKNEDDVEQQEEVKPEKPEKELKIEQTELDKNIKITKKKNKKEPEVEETEEIKESTKEREGEGENEKEGVKKDIDEKHEPEQKQSIEMEGVGEGMVSLQGLINSVPELVEQLEELKELNLINISSEQEQILTQIEDVNLEISNNISDVISNVNFDLRYENKTLSESIYKQKDENTIETGEIERILTGFLGKDSELLKHLVEIGTATKKMSGAVLKGDVKEIEEQMSVIFISCCAIYAIANPMNHAKMAGVIALNALGTAKDVGLYPIKELNKTIMEEFSAIYEGANQGLSAFCKEGKGKAKKLKDLSQSAEFDSVFKSFAEKISSVASKISATVLAATIIGPGRSAAAAMEALNPKRALSAALERGKSMTKKAGDIYLKHIRKRKGYREEREKERANPSERRK